MEPYIHDIEELYIYRLEAYIYLILYVEHIMLQHFMVMQKPPAYLLYMREHTYNDGTLYIYIYISGE